MQAGQEAGQEADEQVVVLDPGCEQAQNLGKAISHPVAGEIVNLMRSGPTSLSVLSEKLNIPINNVKYHIGNLQKAGIIEVAGTKYSEKGRIIRLYQLRDQVFVVSPKKVDLRTFFTRYAALLGLILCAGGSAYLLAPLLSGGASGGGGLEGSVVSTSSISSPLSVFSLLAIILVVLGAGLAGYWLFQSSRRSATDVEKKPGV